MTIDSSAWTYRRNAILADFLQPHDIITALVKTVRCAFVFVACSPVCYSDIARQLELYASACGVLAWLSCLELGADLHMAQLMPLPLTVSCFSKIQIGFTFLVPAHLGSPGKRAVKRVCVWVCACIYGS